MWLAPPISTFDWVKPARHREFFAFLSPAFGTMLVHSAK